MFKLFNSRRARHRKSQMKFFSSPAKYSVQKSGWSARSGASVSAMKGLVK